MFTVKQIVGTQQDQQVRLWEARDVYLERNGITHRPNVYFTYPDGVTCSLDTGLVYVMNDHGKTVESFRLEGSEML